MSFAQIRLFAFCGFSPAHAFQACNTRVSGCFIFFPRHPMSIAPRQTKKGWALCTSQPEWLDSVGPVSLSTGRGNGQCGSSLFELIPLLGGFKGKPTGKPPKTRRGPRKRHTHMYCYCDLLQYMGQLAKFPQGSSGCSPSSKVMDPDNEYSLQIVTTTSQILMVNEVTQDE